MIYAEIAQVCTAPPRSCPMWGFSHEVRERRGSGIVGPGVFRWRVGWWLRVFDSYRSLVFAICNAYITYNIRIYKICIYICKIPMGSYFGHFGHGFNLAPTQEFVKPPTHCCIFLRLKSPDPNVADGTRFSLQPFGGPKSIKKHRSYCWIPILVAEKICFHPISTIFVWDDDPQCPNIVLLVKPPTRFFCMVMSWKIPTISLSDPIILLYLLLKNPLMAHKYHGAFRMENPIKIDDNWGYPQFRKPL